jgi:hypothetical protein
VRALSECPLEGATHAELLVRIRRKESKYPAGNLTQYLRELERPENGGLVRRDSRSGGYAFATPLFRAYAVAHFAREAKVRPREPEQFEVYFTHVFADLKSTLPMRDQEASGFDWIRVLLHSERVVEKETSALEPEVGGTTERANAENKN